MALEGFDGVSGLVSENAVHLPGKVAQGVQHHLQGFDVRTAHVFPKRPVADVADSLHGGGEPLFHGGGVIGVSVAGKRRLIIPVGGVVDAEGISGALRVVIVPLRADGVVLARERGRKHGEQHDGGHQKYPFFHDNFPLSRLRPQFQSEEQRENSADSARYTRLRPAFLGLPKVGRPSEHIVTFFYQKSNNYVAIPAEIVSNLS